VATVVARPSWTQAAEYPARPIKLITQAAAGSGPDVVGRLVAEQLGLQLHQQVVVINHPGAGGLIAAQTAAASEPDGYTLYMPSGSALTILPETHPNLSFSFDRDFVPIGMIAQMPMLIAASAKLNVSSLPDLIALAKKNPGQLNFAGNTPGTVPTLTAEMLKERAGVDVTVVPYPGAAAALKDVSSGRIAVIIEAPAALTGAAQGGMIKIIAVASEKRMAQFPNVPTAAETLPDFRATGWFALMARSGTPDQFVQKISRELRTALQDKGLREKFAKLGAEPVISSPQEMRAFIESEKTNWASVVRNTLAGTR
jgi:tripartite-type tricarboxylate transporter receptor subunit TctC